MFVILTFIGQDDIECKFDEMCAINTLRSN